MKKKYSLIAALAVVFVLSAGTLAAYAAHNDEVDLTGKWHSWIIDTVDTNNDLLTIFNTNVNGYPLWVLKQDGDKISGSFKGSFGELITEGNIKGRHFQMTGILPQGVVTLTGKLEEGKINGVITLGIHGSRNFMMARE